MKIIDFTNKMIFFIFFEVGNLNFEHGRKVGRKNFNKNILLRNLSFDLNFILGSREKFCFSKS